ncbi:hypothetical protein SDC9_175726 [bioreactor metagenome]|uniref:Uncharacterized protein n=1 Tax=bioreactor metagenome TaxID=1076179 RepID=A0A645GNI2_9ZZZZ
MISRSTDTWYSSLIGARPANFPIVSSARNSFTLSPTPNFSFPVAFLPLSTIFFLRSILYKKLPGALARYFFKNLSSLWPASFWLIIISFIVVLFRNTHYIERFRMIFLISLSFFLVSAFSIEAILFIPSALDKKAT